MVNIEKMLMPDGNELIYESEWSVKAKIMDAELDIIECSFNYDGCVTIKTEGYTFLTLSMENLEILKHLTFEAEEYFESLGV